MGVEYTSVRDFARGLGKIPAETRKELRPALRAGGQHIVDEMRSRASYSSRIPGAIRMTVSFAAKGGGIRFKVLASRAPHARVLERGNFGGRASSFRHPVFGDRDAWVTQPTRPFFFPALRDSRGPLRNHIQQAVAAAQRKAL
jgi:hypothetical protein